jgi:hypothetical protein
VCLEDSEQRLKTYLVSTLSRIVIWRTASVRASRTPTDASDAPYANSFPLSLQVMMSVQRSPHS